MWIRDPRLDGRCALTSLYYDPDRNKMMNEDGFIIYDIYRIVPPSRYQLFLLTKEYMVFETSPGCFVELIYPEDDEDDY